MQAQKMLKCLVSGGIALILLGLVWFTTGALAKPHSFHSESPALPASISAPSSYTATIYLPLAVKNYFPSCAFPPLNWAADENGVLLRWRWPEACTSAVTFDIYRTSSDATNTLIAEGIGPITDSAQAIAVLDDDWPVLQSELGITETDQLHDIRTTNAMQAVYLANLHYRVALVYGWGYSDTTGIAGQIYTYTIKAVRQEDSMVIPLGEVVAQAGNITPLDAPTGLTATQVISEDLVGEIDWLQAQKNRKADRSIYLRWDAEQSDPTTLAANATRCSASQTQKVLGPYLMAAPSAASLTPPWLIGYDIYRAEYPTGTYTLLTSKPIIPMPPVVPTTDTLPYELHDYFFQDDDPTLVYSHTYYYRVAPRDLLGRPRDWEYDVHKPQFSDDVEAVPRDMTPPPVPQNLTATPIHLDRQIVLSWTLQTSDTESYRLYWSWHPTASVLEASCMDPETCWMTLADIPTISETNVFTHAGITGPLWQDKPYWYRIRAVDEAANLSAPSEPVYAVLHNRVPPAQPTISVYGEGLLHIDGPEEAAEILLYCTVDDGPYRLWKVLKPDANGDIDYDLYNEYHPPIPTSLVCQAQVVDANGNRSDFSNLTASIRLGPHDAKEPPAPIITVISTTGSAQDGWNAVVNWEAEPTPAENGFRLYRQVGDSGPIVQLADETTLTREKRTFVDNTVEVDKVYSYTVVLYRAAGFYGSSELQIRSQPFKYEVIPPLGDRERQIVIIPWNGPYYNGSGTQLYWTINQECLRSVVFRSMDEDRGYVQLTPPLDREDYLDTDAEHEGYWYIVHWVDCRTGEVIGRTEPWNAEAQPDTPELDLEITQPRPSFNQQLVTHNLANDLPPTLTLGWETESVPFAIGNISYTAGATLTNLSGTGVMTLAGGELSLITRTVDFYNLGAAADGRVLTGSVTLPINQTFDYPGGMRYRIASIVLDSHEGAGTVTLRLPAHTQIVLSGGTPNHSTVLPSTTIIHPDLTFEYEDSSPGLDPCSAMTPTVYFEMNPLPLRIVPQDSISYTHASILFDGGVCTQYEDRLNHSVSSYVNDTGTAGQLLQIEYTGASNAVLIGTDGLEGRIDASASNVYTVTAPYGLLLKPSSAWLQFDDNQIVDGRLNSGSARLFYYYNQPNDEYYPGIPPNYPPPDNYIISYFETLMVGQGGSIYGELRTAGVVSWNGFLLSDDSYVLYIPPIESQTQPWEEAIGHPPGMPQIEPGLNKIGSADLTWENCGNPVTFPDGVVADAYLRRGGVSDYFTATIPPGQVVTASLYGYQMLLTRFRLAFFDNDFYDNDIAGNLTIPKPADIALPLIRFEIVDDGCVQNALVRQGTEPILGYWQIQTHPTAIEFRPNTAPVFPDGMALWILGRIEIPHLALPEENGDPDYESGLPMDLSLTPDGDFYAFKWMEESYRYLMDGFDLLLEGIRLSDAGPPAEQPAWIPEATLGDPPCQGTCSQGFVELDGYLLTPLYGEIAKGDTRPKLHVMAGSDFVGFTEIPSVKRGWTGKVGLGFQFDLLYVHDVAAEEESRHNGQFVAWDQETFLNGAKFDYVGDYLEVFELDWATIIEPEETGVYFGLSTVPALARTLAEATMPTVPVSFTEQLSQTLRNDWITALGISNTLDVAETQGYVDLTSRLWVSITTPLKVTEEIDKLEDENIPTTPTGGGTIGKLKDWGVNFSKIRGHTAFSPVSNGGGEIVDWQLEELRASLQMTISWGSSSSYVAYEAQDGMSPTSLVPYATTPNIANKSFIRAQRITFLITRDGDYSLVGKKVRTTLTERVKDIDFALLLNVTENPRFEGGLVLYDLNFESVKFEKLGGVLGVGEYRSSPFFYLGAQGDAKFNLGSQFRVGGAFLVGTIYTDSVVLRNMGFEDLLDRLGDTGEPGGLLVGAYLRAYGDFPIYDVGCLFRVTVGGEIAGWYFADKEGLDSAWGGRLRGYVYGKLLCVVSARGDLTLEISHPGHAQGKDDFVFRGQFWVAGGIGACDPGSWKSWESRWWKDKWCWACGAMVKANYNLTSPDDWKWDYDADCE